MDASTIKAAALGRWQEILTAVGGIDAALLDGKHHPCPKCGGKDRFRLLDAAAGAVFCSHCFNSKCGDGLAAIHWMRGTGFTATLHLVADYLGLNGATKPNAQKPAARPESIVADDDALNRAYGGLLSRLELSMAHREALRSRGLGDEAIERGGYRTWQPVDPKGAVQSVQDELGSLIEGVPGFYRGRLAAPAGLLIPVRNLTGQIIALKVRLDDPGDGAKYLYVSAAKHGGPSPGAPAHLPLGIQSPVRRVRITEGELKADVATAISGVPTISFPGVSNWRTVAPVVTKLRGDNPSGSLAVSLAFDADLMVNPAVGKYFLEAAEHFHAEGYPVEIDRWPADLGKGIDDALAAGHTPEVLRGEAALAAARQAVPWPELEPFGGGELPEFPTEALPPVLRDFVDALAFATQTPADLPGLLVLAAVSATIARRVVIQARPGWTEPSNLYVAVLLGPGNRKSAVFADATAPLREMESDLIEAARPSWARQSSKRRQDEKRLAQLETIAAKNGKLETAHEAENLAERLADEPEPVLPRLIVDDATPEKVAIILEAQGGRIACMAAEGSIFDIMAGLYNEKGTANFNVYLAGHSGDEIRQDRVSRKSIHVTSPAITSGHAIQPAVIKGLAAKSTFRDRGLLARYLYSLARSLVGQRQIAAPPVPSAVRDAYHAIIHRLGRDQSELTLALSAKAELALREWESEIEGRLAEGGEMELIRDWGSKLAGATLRLAAVLHCAEYGKQGKIREDTLAAAIKIAMYLIPHAEAVLTMMEAKEKGPEDDAQYLLRWILRRNKGEFTKTEAQHHGKRRFPKAEDIDAALAELARRGYIRQRPARSSGPGRPPSPRFEVNPAVFPPAEAGAQLSNRNNGSARTAVAVTEQSSIDASNVVTPSPSGLNDKQQANRPSAGQSAVERYSQNPDCQPDQWAKQPDEVNCGNCGSAPADRSGEASQTPTLRPAADSDHGADWTEFEIL